MIQPTGCTYPHHRQQGYPMNNQLTLLTPTTTPEPDTDHGEIQQCREYIAANLSAIQQRIADQDILPWQCDGYQEPRDVLLALHLIDYEGSILWADTNSKIKAETTKAFKLNQQSNALALVRHLQYDLKYIKVNSYDKDLACWHFGFTELGRLVFELGEMFD